MQSLSIFSKDQRTYSCGWLNSLHKRLQIINWSHLARAEKTVYNFIIIISIDLSDHNFYFWLGPQVLWNILRGIIVKQRHLQFLQNLSKCRVDGYAEMLYFERNTPSILTLFFYFQRWNLSLDNLKRITTISVTIWKLFIYTGLEVIKKNLPKCRVDGYAEMLYLERNTLPILTLFFYLFTKVKPILR